ncbi:PaaI family thioesterase [Caldalkalibacillus mannanilyticus]|uniref:PaaI family thioesterase n=1 Tax=Caldalkalibacillus mannanilyticus TaxID=1418 RepID=UPI000684CC6A|nr:PaaI family thioesterase [Caldalkalibacillus mannanilyticus]
MSNTISNTTGGGSSIIEEIESILESASNQDREILKLAIQSIKQKREKPNTMYLSGFLNHVGEFVDEETFQITIPITPFILNPLQIVHGGITATLADSTMGAVVYRKLPKDKHCVTSEMKINYISAGLGNQLICRAKVVHIGNTLCVAECRITNEKDKLIAIATGTFYIIKAQK